jgi:RNA polymerase sigma factor (sigma-70 family)
VEPSPAQYAAGVERYLRGCGLDADEAADARQDVFLDLLVAFKRGAPRNVEPWLRRVAQRRAWRYRSRRQHSSLAGDEPTLDEHDHDLRIVVRDATRRLPQRYQAILEMHVVIGLSFRAIARQTGITEDAARMRFVRAAQALRDELRRAGVVL